MNSHEKRYKLSEVESLVVKTQGGYVSMKNDTPQGISDGAIVPKELLEIIVGDLQISSYVHIVTNDKGEAVYASMNANKAWEYAAEKELVVNKIKLD